jgi:hypothetical protein
MKGGIIVANGETTQQYLSEFRQGTSLSDIAKAHNVASATVGAAIKRAVGMAAGEWREQGYPDPSGTTPTGEGGTPTVPSSDPILRAAQKAIADLEGFDVDAELESARKRIEERHSALVVGADRAKAYLAFVGDENA